MKLKNTKEAIRYIRGLEQLGYLDRIDEIWWPTFDEEYYINILELWNKKYRGIVRKQNFVN